MNESARPERAGRQAPDGPKEEGGSPGEVFRVFLKLGLTSFGGPIAHVGYFRDELVVRRRWIDEAGYADLVALCQFLPGPASSQVGFSLGVLRGGGLIGGLAAWAGFTAPSASDLVGFRARRLGIRRTGRARLAAWSQARRGRRGRAGALGHGAQASRPIASAQGLRWPRWRSSSRSPHRSRRSPRSALARSPGSRFAAAAAGPVQRSLALSRRPGQWRLRRFACSSRFSWFLRCCAAPCRGSRCSTPSIVRELSFSAAAMSCCRCCRPRSSRLVGSPTTPF